MRAKARFFYFLLLIFFLQTILVSFAAATTRIMPLGDSITWDDRIIETRVDGEKIAYRYSLWQLLTDAGYDFDFVGSEWTGYDIFLDADNEGHPGWHAKDGPDGGLAPNIYNWLEDNPADIVLLHIGTNDISRDNEPPAETAAEVGEILDEIDRYETDYTTEITVVLARIIKRACCEDIPPCPECATTTTFNVNVAAMAQARMPGDKIKIVDMEDGALIDYRLETNGGDMYDNVHPNEDGYTKMADVWFDALEQILPDPNPDPDPDPPKNSSSSDSGCFIGTVTYVSDMEPHAKAPGEFRDYFLHNTFMGRTFVDLYHSIRHLRLISTLDVFIK